MSAASTTSVADLDFSPKIPMKRRLVALVIDNANYPGSNKLKNPVNDANDITERLERFGFLVIKALNCTNRAMDIDTSTPASIRPLATDWALPEPCTRCQIDAVRGIVLA